MGNCFQTTMCPIYPLAGHESDNEEEEHLNQLLSHSHSTSSSRVSLSSSTRSLPNTHQPQHHGHHGHDQNHSKKTSKTRNHGLYFKKPNPSTGLFSDPEDLVIKVKPDYRLHDLMKSTSISVPLSHLCHTATIGDEDALRRIPTRTTVIAHTHVELYALPGRHVYELWRAVDPEWLKERIINTQEQRYYVIRSLKIYP